MSSSLSKAGRHCILFAELFCLVGNPVHFICHPHHRACKSPTHLLSTGTLQVKAIGTVRRLLCYDTVLHLAELRARYLGSLWYCSFRPTYIWQGLEDGPAQVPIRQFTPGKGEVKVSPKWERTLMASTQRQSITQSR
jgi:hypothetical protein